MAATHIYPTSKTEKFIQKARNVHGEKYDYSLVEYKNVRTKINIICPKHGKFDQKPYRHLEGRGCSKCANKKRSESIKSNKKDFIERAKEVHGDLFDYSLVEYKTNKTKVTIICPVHGEFEQIPSSHLSGNGCPKCSNERLKGLFNKKFLKDNPKKAKENCTFYTIEMYNDEESFIKCGITQGTIQKRFRRMKEYDYEIVNSFETTLENAINLEEYFAEKFEKYWPKKQFCGYTESFHIKEREKILQVEC